jgi:hypothetical protein
LVETDGSAAGLDPAGGPVRNRQNDRQRSQDSTLRRPLAGDTDAQVVRILPVAPIRPGRRRGRGFVRVDLQPGLDFMSSAGSEMAEQSDHRIPARWYGSRARVGCLRASLLGQQNLRPEIPVQVRLRSSVGQVVFMRYSHERCSHFLRGQGDCGGVPLVVDRLDFAPKFVFVYRQ